jgi:predicted nucleic acid-binding protein
VADPHTRRYWDSSAFIALIAGEAGRADDCRRLLDEAASGNYLAYTSAISLIEVTRKRNQGVLARQRDTIEGFFENDYIQLINADRFTIRMARDLIWAYLSLRPYDALHLASAIRGKCSLMYTYDNGLLKFNGSVSGIQIVEPVWVGRLSLEEATEIPPPPAAEE